MPKHKRDRPNKSYFNNVNSADQGYLMLALNILLLAIEDVRQTRDERKRRNAKEWLLSPAALFMADLLMDIDISFDWKSWVMADCPVVKRIRQK